MKLLIIKYIIKVKHGREYSVRATKGGNVCLITLTSVFLNIKMPQCSFCSSAVVSLNTSLASGKEVFSSEETDHHVAQQDSHLGAAHHQAAVGVRDHSSTQTNPNTNTTPRTNPRPRTHGGPLLTWNSWHVLRKKRNNKQTKGKVSHMENRDTTK